MSLIKPFNAIFPPDSAHFGHPNSRINPGDDLVETVLLAKPGWIAANWQELIHTHEVYWIIGTFRSSILGTPWDFRALAVSTLSSAAIQSFGLFFFRRNERLIADIV